MIHAILAATLIGIVLAALGLMIAPGSYRLFTLREHKRNPDRLSDHLPWAMLVAPGIVFNKDGSFQSSFKFRGPDLDSATQAELVIVSAQINNALKRLAGGWALYADTHRRTDASYPESIWPDALTHLLDEERRVLFEGDRYFDSTCYFTLLYLPPRDVADKVARFFYEGGEEISSSCTDQLKLFVKTRDDMANLLSGVIKEIRALNDEETCTYLHACVSPKTHVVKAPDIPMFLDSLLTDTPLTGGFAPRLGAYHIQVLSIGGFPNMSTPGILDVLNRLDFEYRWVTRFIFLDKTEAEGLLRGFWQRWLSGRQSFVALMREAITGQGSAIQNTDALNKSADADAALQELSGDLVSYGYFTQCIVLLDQDPKSLKAKQAILEQAIQGRGFVILDEIENRNCFDAFLGSIPGNCAHNVRHPMMNTLNLAHLFPLSAVWAGEPRESNLYDGPPLLHTVTGGSTPFKFNLNFADVGHACIVGPTGAGKSVLLAAIASAFCKYRSPKDGEFAQVYFFDKERSSRITTLGVGGAFYDLAAEEGALSFQPLAHIDEEAERNWGMEWLQALLQHEVKSATFVTPEKKAALWNALSRLAASPRQERTLTGLRTLVQDKALKDALAPYCIDGPYGRLLDAEEDTLSAGRWQVFEMHELMKSYPNAVMPVLTYLFHRLDQRFGRAPTLLILDEGWLFLDDPVFAPKIREWLKTLRKKKVYVVFASQSLADLSQSTILETVKESCFTKIYLPNKRALDDERSMDFYRGFGLNDQQIAIIANATPKREYYFTSPLGNRLFSLALGELGLAYCAATGADDQALADQWCHLSTSAFNDHYLRAKGLSWAADALAAASDESLRKRMTASFRERARMPIFRKKISISAVTALLVCTSSVQVAHAQLAVIDPANLVENIISAVQNMAAVVKQATQLEHEVQSLANEAQNLQRFPSILSGGVLGQYLTQYASLISTMQGIDGIARNLATLTGEYNTTFPNTALSNGPLSYSNVMTQLTGWLGQSRSVYQGAYQTQAQVMSTLGPDSGNIAQLLQQSGKSSGALDAIQAGNLLTGQVASQLMKLNQQMAATDQAQMNWIAQQTQLLAQAQQTQQTQLVGYTTPGTPVVNASLDSLH